MVDAVGYGSGRYRLPADPGSRPRAGVGRVWEAPGAHGSERPTAQRWAHPTGRPGRRTRVFARIHRPETSCRLRLAREVSFETRARAQPSPPALPVRSWRSRDADAGSRARSGTRPPGGTGRTRG